MMGGAPFAGDVDQNPNIQTHRRVILASASPRRRELLRQIVENFEVLPSEIEEPALPDPWETAKTLARDKARAIAQSHPDAIVIGADTVVAYMDHGWQQLAKPEDEEDAKRMLAALSGRGHVVITGIAVMAPGFEKIDADTTGVRVRVLTQKEIADYVATGEPMDKAGAYAIQGGARGFIVDIDGSLSNVIGLPLELLKPILDHAMAKGT